MILQVINIAKFAVFKSEYNSPGSCKPDGMEAFVFTMERMAFPFRRQFFKIADTI
jgi:hypothetical protein